VARMVVAARTAAIAAQGEAGEAVSDDRDLIEPGDAVVLIVEDDPRFAAILLALVQESGFKGVVTPEGSAAPSLARRFGPEAIMLDIGLPDMDGLALLDLLKRMPETRHIPVHVISADDQRGLGLSIGAFGFTHKPVEREVVVSTLAGVRDFVARKDRRVALVGGDDDAKAALESCFKVTTPKDVARALSAESERKVEGVVIQVGPAGAAEIVDAVRAGDRLRG